MKRILLMAVGNLEIFTAVLIFDVLVYGAHGEEATKHFSLSHDWGTLTFSLVIAGLGALLIAYNARASLKEGRRGTIWQVIRGAGVLGFTALGLAMFCFIGLYMLWPMLLSAAVTGIWALFEGLTRAALAVSQRRRKGK